MRKKVLTIVLTAIVYLSAVGLGLSTVFRVRAVSLDAAVISEGASERVQTMREELLDAYESEGTLSVNKSKAEKVLSKYPYFRLISFKKSYPDTLYIQVVEDSEVYAVQTGEEYYILSKEGIVVERRKTPVNRLDKGDNVLVTGLDASGDRGEELVGDPCWQTALRLCQGMDTALDGIRKNVLSLDVLKRGSEIFYRLTMREGVKIYIDTPDTLTDEKSKRAVDEYLSLSDIDKTLGYIGVHEIDGKVTAEHKKGDFPF